jgi:D-alanine-D-alanine ligase
MRVLLIAGGWSNEREVSLSGAAQIKQSLINLGHDVIFFDLDPDLGRLMTEARGCDAAFINLHGHPGEDGMIQALLDDIGIPYQGSGPLGSFLALNKHISKQIFINHKLPTPCWQLLTAASKYVSPDLKFPLVAKPNTGGSSLGMAIIKNSGELQSYVHGIIPGNDEVILEEYIRGLELTCAVLEDRALPPILINPLKGSFFDYASKYDLDGATEICPAPVSEKVSRQVCDLALEVHRILGLRHYSRTDFMMDNNENIYILEANTLPGMTRTSLVPKAALTAGLDFTSLVEKLLALALESRQETIRGNYG